MIWPAPRGARALGAAALLATCFAAPSLARADGLVFRLPLLGQSSYSFTDTTLATYRVQNFDHNPWDDNFFSMTERFDSALQAAPWRFSLRIDGFAPIFRTSPMPAEIFTGSHIPSMPTPGCPAGGSPIASGCDYLRPDLRVERFGIRYQRGILTAEGGDYYFVIGRGIALSFRKVDPLGLDTTLRGAHVDVDAGPITARAFGGYANPQNLDPITLQVNHDWGGGVAGSCDASAPGGDPECTLRPRPDILGGLDFAARLFPDEDVEVGVHALRINFAEQGGGRDENVDVIGYRMGAPSLLDGTLSLYGEVNALRRGANTYRGDGGMLTNTTDTFGRAIFASAQYTSGGWTGLLEFKDYDNYYLSPNGGVSDDPRRVYSSAPSLERDDVQFRTNSNVRGGRFRLERAFRPSAWIASITAVANGFTEGNDVDPWDPHTGYGAAHAYVTLRRRGRTVTPTRAPSGADAGASAGGNRAGSGSTTSAGDTGGGAVNSASVGGLGSSATRVAAGEWQLLATLGYRHEFLLGDRGGTVENPERHAGDPDWQIVHGDVDVAFAIDGNNSLDIKLDGRLERRWTDFLPTTGNGGYYMYTRSGIALTWSHSDRLTVSAVARVDNTAEAQGNNNAPRMMQEMGVAYPWPLVPIFYPAGEIRYMFAPGDTIRLFGGMTPGGRLCTGGVCRDVPPFQGAIAELVLRL